jgi:hypothetical protein
MTSNAETSNAETSNAETSNAEISNAGYADILLCLWKNSIKPQSAVYLFWLSGKAGKNF